MNIIGEFSLLSRIKVFIEYTFPNLYEYLYLHPCARVQDHFNGINTLKEIENWDGKITRIELETVNRCNGSCSFCPVSQGNDPAPTRK